MIISQTLERPGAADLTDPTVKNPPPHVAANGFADCVHANDGIYLRGHSRGQFDRPRKESIMTSKPPTRIATRHASLSQPWLHQHGAEIQEFGTVRLFPLGLSRDARLYSCQRLNRILADTQILHALYKKHHWLMRGATFYQLHLLLDKHADAQNDWRLRKSRNSATTAPMT